MYNVTQTYLNAIKAPAQEHDLFGELGNDYFSKDNIVSGTFHIQNQCTATDDVVLGSVYTGTLTATFHGITHIGRYDWVGQQIKPIFAIKNAHNVWEQVPLGIFTIKEAKHTAEGVEVTAYDDMIKFDRKFDASNFRTAKKMYGYITDVCGICGVHFGMTEQQVQALPNGNTKIGIVGTKSNKELKEFGNDVDTYRDLVFWMAQTMACFATINRDGELVFRQYKDGEDADDEVTEDYRLAGAEFDDFVTNYTGIYVKNTKSGNDIYYGYDVAALQQEITETENKIVGYEEDLDEAAEKYAHGEITEAEYRRIVKNLEKKTKQAETRLQWLEDALVKAQNGEDGLFMDLGENPFLQPDGVGTQYPEMRRRILNALDVISYTPFSCSTVFGVHYDLGDIIQFTGGHATAIGETCCLMAYDYTFNGEYVMQGFGSDPSKPVIKEKTAKSANKADKNGVSGGRTSVGSSVPTEGSEGDVHFTTGAGIDDEIIQTDNIHPQSTTQHPIRLYDFTGDYSSGYDFKVDGNPDGYGNGETIRIDVEGLEVGGQYHVEFDMQFTRADGGWMSITSYDGVSFCGSVINFTSDRNLHHYSGDFTYTENGQVVLTFYKIYDNYNFTAVFSNMVFTPADDSISGASVYHNDEWKNVDYVRKVTQVVSSGTQVATAENSDGTTTAIYTNTPEIEANPTGVGTEDLEKLRIGSTIYDLAGGSEAIEKTQAQYDALSESEKLDPKKVYYITDGGGGGGASALSELTDVELTDLADGEILKYDATEEKWVNAEDGGSGGGSVVALPTLYSTKEKMVGLWTDNKPLYQKTFKLQNITVQANGFRLFHISDYISNIDQYVCIQCVTTSPDKLVLPLLYANSVYNQYNLWYGNYGDDLYISRGSGGDVTFDFEVAVQYTKTTDTPVEDFNLQDFGIFAPVIYSLEEREIGVWTDGKPLYQKTVDMGTLSADTYKTVLYADVGISNIEHVAYIDIIINDSYNVNFNRPDNVYTEFYSQLTATGIFLRAYNTAITRAVANIRYTKTTDVAGSGSYAQLGVPAVHYSTNEHVVGTWIDGKTLYEKTIYSTTQVQLVNTEWRTIPWVNAPSNVDVLIHAKFNSNVVPTLPALYRFYSDNGVIKGAAAGTYDFPPSSAPLYVTIQYTKTS